MYGQIGVDEWGFIPRKDRKYDAEEDRRSDWFGLKTEEQLKSVVQENHPILLRIRDREREIERLASNYPASEEDVPEEERRPTVVTLSSLLKEAIEEQGHDSEQVQKYQAAINWQENADEIKKFQAEYSDLHHSLFSWASEFPWSVYRKPTEEEIRSYNLKRQQYFSAESSLRWAIQSAVTKGEWGEWGEWYEKCYKDYDFRTGFEEFLSDITRARQDFREELREESGQEIRNLVQKYLDNPLWHLPQITNFLLLDLIDFDLISLEVTFYFGLFAPNISNEIDGLHSDYYPGCLFFASSFPSFKDETPCLAPKAKKARRKRRLKQFWIGAVLGLIWTAKDQLINEGVPSWIFGILVTLAILLVLFPIMQIVLEYINKRKIKYNSICSQANDLLNIRWDISSGTYDAKTCIERLKKLDDQDLHTSSLVYPLLELKISSDTKGDIK